MNSATPGSPAMYVDELEQLPNSAFSVLDIPDAPLADVDPRPLKHEVRGTYHIYDYGLDRLYVYQYGKSAEAQAAEDTAKLINQAVDGHDERFRRMRFNACGSGINSLSAGIDVEYHKCRSRSLSRDGEPLLRKPLNKQNSVASSESEGEVEPEMTEVEDLDTEITENQDIEDILEVRYFDTLSR